MTSVRFDANKLAHNVRAGDRRSLAKAITLVESRAHADQECAAELLSLLLPFAGNATRLGITGVPGVGKSTFIDNFGAMLLRSDRRIAVLAVDPSSNQTNGSILGDKTRMSQLATNSQCFVRPSPAGGELGGVAAMTREAIIVCEAAGFDTIIVETVGVGQSEYVVAEMVDYFLVLMLPGAGDDLQAIKKGIIELADMIVVNKADGDRVLAAEQAAQQIQHALQFIASKKPLRQPETLLASPLTNVGLHEIRQIVDRQISLLRQSGDLEKLRRAQNLRWLEADYQRQVLRRLDADSEFQNLKSEILVQVSKGQLAPTQGANQLAGRVKVLGSPIES